MNPQGILAQVSSGPNPITGTPQFIALSRLQRQPATLATELESLAYCFMHSATEYRLHWSHAVLDTPHAIDMKAAAIAWPEYFEQVVIKRTTLHQPARRLRELFSPCGHSASITIDKFLSCIMLSCIMTASVEQLLWEACHFV